MRDVVSAVWDGLLLGGAVGGVLGLVLGAAARLGLL